MTNPTRAVRKLPPVSAALPFDVQRHPAARSHVAQSMLQRLKDDCKVYADEQNLGTVWKMVSMLDEDIEAAVQSPASALVGQAVSKMDTLLGLLQALKQRDLNFVNVGIQRVLELANEFEQGSISHVDMLNADGSYSAGAASKLAKGVGALASSLASPYAAASAPAPPPPPPSAGGVSPRLASQRPFAMPDQSTRGDWQELETDEKRKYYYNSVTNVTAWDKPDALKTRGELEIEWEHQWEELVADGDDKRHYFYCASTGLSVWSIPHARRIKFIPNSPLWHQWAGDMRRQGFEPEDKPQHVRRNSLEKKAASAASAASNLFSAVKTSVQSAMSSAASAVSKAVRSRSNSLGGNNNFALHPPQSPFLLTKGSQNVSALSFASARHAGAEPTLWFEYLVTSLLSTGMDADMMLHNPFLTPQQILVIRDITVAIMFHTNRIGQINRCLIEAFDLMKLLRSLQKVGSSGRGPADVTLKQALILKATTLASNLATKRHYLRESRRNEKNIPVFAFDPRYAVFEFSDNLVLRDSQISLVDRYVQQTQVEGKSLCSQMLMGAGKVSQQHMCGRVKTVSLFRSCS